MTVEEYARDVGKVMAEEAHKLGLQMGQERGLEQGRQEGLQLGRQESSNREKEIILNMIKAGMSNVEILKLIPDITEETIEIIRTNN